VVDHLAGAPEMDGGLVDSHEPRVDAAGFMRELACQFLREHFKERFKTEIVRFIHASWKTTAECY
jgi:hypothetical protein